MTRFGVHFYQLPPRGGPDQPMLEVYTLLGALAARTRRVQLGTLILGIGGACYDVEHQGLGIDYPSDRVRGGGEKRTLRLVARYADMCNVMGDVSTLARKIGVLRRHCAEVGRDPAEVAAVAQAFGLGGQ